MDDFEQFREDLTLHHSAMLSFLQQVEKEAQKNSPERLLKYVRQESTKVTQTLESLSARSGKLQFTLQKTLDQRTSKLETEIEELKRIRDNLLSDNLLLEDKKKDLLVLTGKLEEANEEISVKNKELLQQQKKITDQAHQEILEKHRELEKQKEALLDQSDYLHEANQAITLMHEKVQKQKDEILQKNEELLSLNNEKNNLIGIVAHDLKSPLNQMKGLIALIKASALNLDKETLACLEMMEKSADRLTTLIAKILDVEAIESRQPNLSIERVNLSELLQGLEERSRQEASMKSIDLHFTIDPGRYAMVDKIYTSQIFENLISNAIKFSPPDKNIYIRLSVSNNEVVAGVLDEGPGISEEDKKKLFLKYQKLSARPTGNESSTGLGLSIVKKFVDAMSGRIWCESEWGKGASFFVAFRQA